MKEERKEIKTYKTVYVAIDGTEFQSAKDCEEYEKTAECVIFSKINGFTINTGSEEDIMGTGSCDNYCYVLKPMIEEDVDAINHVCSWVERRDTKPRRNGEVAFSYDIIGKTIIFNVGYDGDCWWYQTLDELVKKITNDKMEVVITERD